MQQTSGIIIEDLVVGQGEGAVVGDTTIVHYVGKLTTGQVFDSSRDRNQTFPVTLGQGRVIKGWEEGLLGMKVGGTRRLTISPELAYGPNDYGPIPGNSTLIFDIELIDIVKPAIQ
ncbi:MAG: FKBP-type peptidyl-prolyl cis-trans isomerase [bacterium]|nr:FKBP-type peptidyl-prolyl cis-trans isomerase [bacterium]